MKIPSSYAGMSGKEIVRLSANPEGFGQVQDELGQDMFVSDVPIQHTHLYYEDDEQGLYVGVWDTTDMTELAAPYACDEFMVLLEGEVEIKNNKTGTVEKVEAGEAFIIPRGYDSQWQQKGYLRKFFVILEHPEEEIPQTPVVEGIIKLRGSAGEQDQANAVCYEDSRGRFGVGSWFSHAIDLEGRPATHNLFVSVIAGGLSLGDEEGVVHEFSAGDAFFVPQGTVCSWRVPESVGVFYTKLKSRSG